MRTSAHQVLPPEQQESIEKNLILNILTSYAIADSVELIYDIIHAALHRDGSQDIDVLIQKVKEEYDSQEHDKDVIQAEWKKTLNKDPVNNWLDAELTTSEDVSSQSQD